MAFLQEEFDKAANLCNQHKFSEAKQILMDLTIKYPDFSDAYRLLGQIAFEEGKIDDAVDILITALVKDSKNMWALIMMGNIYGRNKNDLVTAKIYYDKVIEFYPDNYIALNNIAAVMMECNDFEGAIALFKKIIEMDDTYPNTYYGLGLAYEKQGLYQEAFDIALDGVKKSKDRPENKGVRNETIRLLFHVSKKLCSKTNYWKFILSVKEELESEGNHPIELIYDDKLNVYAKLEYCKHRRREKNIVRYNGSMENFEHLIVHELGHLRLMQANSKCHVGKIVHSSPENDSNFIKQHGSFLKKKLSSLGNSELAKLYSQIHTGINMQILNCPIDLFVERYIYEHYPIMRPLQLLMLFKQEQDNIESVRKGASTPYFPPKIVKANKVMNICTSFNLKHLYGFDLINEYKPTKAELDLGKDLFEEFEAYWNDKDLKSGDEYDLVEYFADSLEMSDIISITDEDKFFSFDNSLASFANADDDFYSEEEKESQKCFEEENKTPDQIRDMMITMGIFNALEFFKDKSISQVKQIAQEIAILGMSGIHPNKTSGYSIPSIPNKDFGGNEILAYYYTSWKLAIPEMVEKLGLPYIEQYRSAQDLYKAKYGDYLSLI